MTKNTAKTATLEDKMNATREKLELINEVYERLSNIIQNLKWNQESILSTSECTGTETEQAIDSEDRPLFKYEGAWGTKTREEWIAKIGASFEESKLEPYYRVIYTTRDRKPAELEGYELRQYTAVSKLIEYLNDTDIEEIIK